ncbi:DUF2147 domain-containing protein [Novosphingobium gossypii]|uniref:DUF2147 domain-containing protein n=1 Tax=Novosphingobium gossypii TaxID=1604774 RepID=UPI003D24C740
MSYRTTIVLPLLAALAAPVQAGAIPAASPAEGVWLNPSGSVAVRTAPCAVQAGQGLCGHIVWASAKAKADAQDSGIGSLVGIELLQDYRPAGSGAWRGTVYVPDMGRRFDSRIETLSPARLKVSGCLLGGWLCRSQVWTRIAQVPA